MDYLETNIFGFNVEIILCATKNYALARLHIQMDL